MAGFGDLVLYTGTTPKASFEEQIVAASYAGCAGISVQPPQAVDGIARLGSIAAARRMLGDHGVEVVDVDCLIDWIDHPDHQVPSWMPSNMLIPRMQLLEMAANLGARGVNVVDLSNINLPIEVLAESFAHICDAAASFGLLIYTEFFFGSDIKDLATAAKVVTLANRPNGGILLDTLHYHRGPSARENQLPVNAHLVQMLQVNDAAAQPPEDQALERRAGRLLPGEGVIDLVGVLTAVRDNGSSVPIGLEINNAALHALAPRDAALKAADAMRHVLSLLPPATG